MLRRQVGASDRSLTNLNRLDLFVAQMQLGFGAFLSVYLTTHLWTRTDIGFALSVGTVTGMVAQIPAGALVDAVDSKRGLAGAAILAIAAAALIIAIWPLHSPVLLAEILQGGASCVLAPAIAAITLALAQPDRLAERFGRNVRFAAIGSILAAAVMGAVGYWFTHRAIFCLAAVCGLAALAALRGISAADLEEMPRLSEHIAAAPPRRRTGPVVSIWQVITGRSLLVFAGCMMLFQLGSAAMLPIAANAASIATGQVADLVIGAAIIVPQAVAALLSPPLGRVAQQWGRRPVLLLGLAALPLRALLFASNGDSYLMVGFQALDGISAAVLGMMVPLVVADITRRRGRFNLSMGVVLLAMGIGATLSTTLAGAIADRFGNAATFLALGGAGLAACALMWGMLPETGYPTPQLKPA
jgi:MFS family permease